MAWAWKQQGLMHAAKLVLLRLCDFANHDNECWPSQARIASDCGMPRETVNRAIKQLVESGRVENRAQTDNGIKTVSHYVIRCDAPSHGGSDATSHPSLFSDVTSDQDIITKVEEEERTSSLRSDGETSSPPLDPIKEIYDRGVKILGDKGRSLLAKMVSLHGPVAVLGAIVACEEETRVEPASFLIKACEVRARDAPQNYHAKPIAKMSPVDKLYLGGHRATENFIRRQGIVADDPAPAFPLLDGGRSSGNA